MRRLSIICSAVLAAATALVLLAILVRHAPAADATPVIPPPADHKIDFHKEVVPILDGSCVRLPRQCAA